MIPDNFAPSKRRLESPVKRLKHQSPLLQKHGAIIKEQEKTEIIEPVKDSEIVKPGEVHYTPHKEVVHDNRATKKVQKQDLAFCRKSLKFFSEQYVINFF